MRNPKIILTSSAGAVGDDQSPLVHGQNFDCNFDDFFRDSGADDRQSWPCAADVAAAIATGLRRHPFALEYRQLDLSFRSEFEIMNGKVSGQPTLIAGFLKTRLAFFCSSSDTFQPHGVDLISASGGLSSSDHPFFTVSLFAAF